MSAPPLIVEAERSGTVESTHEVDVAVVDADGRLVASAGDPDRIAAFRSSAKPLQARAALAAGWEPADTAHLAIACASHNGEHAHVEAVRAVLASAGLTEAALACPPAVPFQQAAALAADAPRPIFHNCSGKHAGMLAACVAAGWDTDGYLDPGHPLQRAIDATLRPLIGDGPVLVDGCGAPTPVAPLRAFAAAFLAVDDGGPETPAMRAHPFLVGGTARFDTDLMAAVPDVTAKSGAEGLACISAHGFGIALKVRDGTSRARGPAAMAVLDQLGVTQPGLLDKHRSPAVVGGGEPVGSLRARGHLARS